MNEIKSISEAYRGMYGLNEGNILSKLAGVFSSNKDIIAAGADKLARDHPSIKTDSTIGSLIDDFNLNKSLETLKKIGERVAEIIRSNMKMKTEERLDEQSLWSFIWKWVVGVYLPTKIVQAIALAMGAPTAVGLLIALALCAMFIWGATAGGDFVFER